MEKYLEVKKIIEREINQHLESAMDLNEYLADNPEVSGEEYKASKKIVSILQEYGFKCEYPFIGIPTAFRSVYGLNNHKHKIAILAEYDALPGIGHGCGHCVSASISTLAGIVLRDLQEGLNADIHLIGTPAEEEDGSKCQMVDEGIFDHYDMAIMIHLYNQNLLYCNLLAMDSYIYEFSGKAAHASAAPWDGRNALNGAQLMMHGIDMLRQHVTPDVRMHAVYRDGGLAPNIVPEKASIELFIRSLEREYLNQVVKKADDCAKGAAVATQTLFRKTPTSRPYDNLLNNETGLRCLREVYSELGINVNGDHNKIFGSSDIGNVSFRCPTFHPTLQLVDRDVAIHTREFENAVKTENAKKAIASGAEIVSLFISKVFMNQQIIESLKADFEEKKCKA